MLRRRKVLGRVLGRAGKSGRLSAHAFAIEGNTRWLLTTSSRHMVGSRRISRSLRRLPRAPGFTMPAPAAQPKHCCNLAERPYATSIWQRRLALLKKADPAKHRRRLVAVRFPTPP